MNDNNSNDNTTNNNRLPLYEYKAYLIDNIPYTSITIILTGELKNKYDNIHAYRKRHKRNASKTETFKMLLSLGIDAYTGNVKYKRYIQRLQEQEQERADAQAAEAAEKQAAEINGLFDTI